MPVSAKVVKAFTLDCPSSARYIDESKDVNLISGKGRGLIVEGWVFWGQGCLMAQLRGNL